MSALDDLRNFDKTAQYHKIFKVLLDDAQKNKKINKSFSTQELYEKAQAIGYSPIEYIVNVIKIYDYYDIVNIWSKEFSLPIATSENIILRAEWYVEFDNKDIGVASPANYLLAKEKFYDRNIVLISQNFLELKDMDEEGIKGLFYNIIQDCQKSGVSDVHFEIREFGYEVKGRLLGEIIPLTTIPMSVAHSLQQIIKTIASSYSQIDTEKWNIRQDARIEIAKRKLDLRLAFSPSVIEKFQNIVIRLLSKEHTRIKGIEDIMNLGYLNEDAKKIIEFNELKTGLNLMSGATGSGKSRSLNSLISLIKPNRSIRTVEDPVEYILEHAVQHQTFKIDKEDERESVNMDYLAYTLAFMRQDPDIIFVGEWRKIKELTDTLLYASETGHLVYSTLHSSRVVNIPNLLVSQYGLQKEDLSNNVNILINQKLVKKLCSYCSKTVEFSAEDLDKLNFIKMLDNDKFKKLLGKQIQQRNPDGCEHCRVYHPQDKNRLMFTGYQGRTVLYEYLPFTIEVRILMSKTTNSLEIEQKMIELSNQKDAKTYIDVAIEKLLLGQIDTNTIATELAG